ncbi:enhancer of yellow 2 transcription factor-like isoform X2 [Lycorma delicatula]|uniref:enhancer of yellow 2 transcription factor-like isoform X2 n=1 Tax=Lycorma delicatula TaxID=130591 RepID=UPI003F50D9F2
MDRESEKERHDSMAQTAIVVMGCKGDYDRFKELLRRRLTECGWTDQIRIMCKDAIKERGTSLTVDQLLEEVSPKARSVLPTTIKRELLQKVKEYLLYQADYYSKENERHLNQ